MKVGIDSVEVERIEKLVCKNERFIECVFSCEEQSEFKNRSSKPEHIAAAYAAKEAFSKAIGTGVAGFKLCEVSLLHEENGKPFLEFSGNAEEIVKENKLSFDVSITHTKTVATAIVIAF